MPMVLHPDITHIPGMAVSCEFHTLVQNMSAYNTIVTRDACHLSTWGPQALKPCIQDRAVSAQHNSNSVQTSDATVN